MTHTAFKHNKSERKFDAQIDASSSPNYADIMPISGAPAAETGFGEANRNNYAERTMPILCRLEGAILEPSAMNLVTPQ